MERDTARRMPAADRVARPAPDSQRHYLAPLFEPASVAIVGASEKSGSIGGVLIRNMREASYQGRLYAVNPGHRTVAGIRCHDSIGDITGHVDLAVIATPARTVPEIMTQCGRAGVKAAVVITAGFSEAGEEGAALEQAVIGHARQYGIRVLGPNCLGIMRPALGINATFARNAACPGSLGLISQSGAVCTALLDWATPNGIGFSSVISLGGSTDVDFGEIIDYLVCDPATEHILLYIEGVRDARRFVGALRAASRVKPVILMKVGRHPAGSRAAQSHTGAMVGADDVFDAVVRRAGVVRVNTIGQLVAAAQALASHVRPRGDRLAIITNGGGPGVMAADRAADQRLPLAEFSPATLAALQAALPPHWSHGNPVDLIGDADPERFRRAVGACLSDTGVDGVLVILTPQAMTDPESAARAVVDAARGSDKPLLTCWMGEQAMDAARRLFRQARIPWFSTPEPAVDMFGHLSAFYRNQRTLLQIPPPLVHQTPPDTAAAIAIATAALKQQRRQLTQAESKAVLSAFHIPVTRTLRSRSPQEAVTCAEQLGYPVALKIDSPDITHKSDVAGVALDIASPEEVRAAYVRIVEAARQARPQARIDGVTIEPMVSRGDGREVMIGMFRDRVFGPAISFGAGGTAVEILADKAIELPPINRSLATEMIRRTRISRMLGAFRNLPPVDMAALEAVLMRVSEMACEMPCIEEMDINPLMVDPNGALALDARIRITPPAEMRHPYEHLAIHPYPANLERCVTLRGGSAVVIRPIRPEDAEIESEFVRGLSANSRYFRFMGTLRELTPGMLMRFTQIDYDREMALIAVQNQGGNEVELAVARYFTNPDGRTCEFAIVVADGIQRQGLGQMLMRQLINVASERGLTSMVGQVLPNNPGMLALCRKLGFQITDCGGDLPMKDVTLRLAGVDRKTAPRH